MNKPPIGYRSKIRKKRPRIIISLIIISAIITALILIYPNFKMYKDSFTFSDNIKKEEVSDSNTTSNRIQVTDNNEELLYETKSESVEKLKEENEFELNDTNNLSKDKITETNNSIDQSEKVKEIPDALSLSNNKTENFIRTVSDTSVSKNNKYYVIVSSVESKQAAEEQQNIFKKMGVKTDVIYISSNKRYRISVGTYLSLKEATDRSDKFQRKFPSYKTWVWKAE